jgi:hypothetical protein
VSETSRQAWLRAALLLGVGYCLIGVLFALPTGNVRAWRLAAWVVSAVLYAAHISYERFKLRSSTPSAALHVAVAVALGAFGLALAAVLHSLSAGSTTEHRRLLGIALVVWPLITSLPAFLVALAAGAVLGRLSRGAHVD